MMELVYLATPYTHKDKEVRVARYKEACMTMVELMKRGLAVYCPIAQTHPLACDFGLAVEFAYWKSFDFTLLSKCDILVVCEMDGWLTSVGVTEEINMARDFGLRIQYFNPETGVLSSCPTRASFQKTQSETKSESENLSGLN